MIDFVADLRLATRSLLRRPGFAAVAALTLALGIGANTALFSIVDAVLLRPLPYAEPGRLAALWTQFPEDGLTRFPFSEAELLDLEAEVAGPGRPLTAVGAAATASTVLTGLGEPVRLAAASATAGLWTTLGAEAEVGRLFGPEEDRPGAEPMVVISHGLWQRRFAGDAAVVGRRLLLDGEPHTVVGVLPASFAFPSPTTELWAPLALPPGPRKERSGHYLQVVGRLAPGASFEVLEAELGSTFERWRGLYGHAHPMTSVPLYEQVVGDVRRPLSVLLAAVGFLLLVASANVAGLLVARADGRRRELAVRTALGASRGRLVRQMLAESLVLAALGGAAGLALAAFATERLPALLAADVPRLGGVAIDGRGAAFTAALVVATCLACGLLPGWQVARRAPMTGLRQGGGGRSPGPPRQRLRPALVVAQVALATVLVGSAGLLLRSFGNLLETPPGFDDSSALAARIELSSDRYDDRAAAVAFFSQLLDDLRGLPGVEAAGLVTALPLREEPPVEGVRVAGRERPAGGGDGALGVRVQLVSPGAFAALGVPRISGRELSAADREDAPRVAAVNRAFVEALLGDGPVLGERLELLAADPISPPLEIVAEVGDVRDAGLTAPARPTLYLPYAQAARYLRGGGAARTATLVLRTAGEPGALAAPLRRRVWAIDPELAVYGVQPLAEVVAGSLARPRFLAALVGLFSSLALLLAAVGVYGLMAQIVGRRTRELGIRFALGAGRGDVVALVVGRGLALAGAGVGLGLAATVVAGRALGGLLHGVAAADPVSLAATAVALGLAAVAACWLPAARAARVEPAVALAAE